MRGPGDGLLWHATPGLKAVLLANEVGNATRNANIPVERMNAPMPDQMTKELFLQRDWSVVEAKPRHRAAQKNRDKGWRLDS